MKIAASVILYNPDIEVVKQNIATYIDHVMRLIIVDNSDQLNIEDEYFTANSEITYIKNKINVGIATALNQACDLALETGCDFLLTMDQDSSFNSDQISDYIKSISENSTAQVGVYCLMHNKEMLSQDRSDTAAVDSAITSGSIINLQVWRSLKGYKELLFIDEVDHEYCYRVKLNGYAIVCFTGLFINHLLGTKHKKGYGGMVALRERTLHNSHRVYYMVRNYLYVRRKYGNSFPKEFKSRDKQFRTMLKNNLFFSGHFAACFLSIIKGLLDYRKLR